jgi:hypothetical protein
MATQTGATMPLPNEAAAGAVEMQPRRGITWWAYRDDAGEARKPSFTLFPRSASDRWTVDDLRDPCPKGWNTL